MILHGNSTANPPRYVQHARHADPDGAGACRSGPAPPARVGRQIGKLMYEFRKASNDFKFQMEEELRQAEEADRRKKEEAERQRALAAAPPPLQIEAPLKGAMNGAPG